jgi:hypothetical protein
MSFRVIQAALLMAALSAGCTATTSLTAAQGGSSVEIKETKQSNLPRSETLGATTFGNYEFKAESPGFEPLYGVLPLRLNGTYMALDILFFCPALFFNLREVFPNYELDLEKRVIRYRREDSDPWVEYQPTADESARAQKYFFCREGRLGPLPQVS